MVAQVPIVIISDALIRDLGAPTGPHATPSKGQPAAPSPSGPHSPLPQPHASATLDARSGTPGYAKAVPDDAAQAQPQQPTEEPTSPVSATSSRQQLHASSDAPASEHDILADLLAAAASDKQPAASTSHASTEMSNQGTQSTRTTQTSPSADLLPKLKSAGTQPESQLSDSSGDILEELLAAAGGSQGSELPALPAARFESQPTQPGIDLEDDGDAILAELLSGQAQASTRQQPQPSSSLKDNTGVQSNSSNSSHTGKGDGLLVNELEQSQQHARQISCNGKPVSATRRLDLDLAGDADSGHGAQPQLAGRLQPQGRPQPQRQTCASLLRGPNQKCMLCPQCAF